MFECIKEFCEKVVCVLRMRYYGRFGYPFVENVNNRKHNWHALLVYEVLPFLRGGRGLFFSGHSRWRRNQLMVKVLDKAGYCVDVVYHKSPLPKLRHEYELMIGLQPLVFKLAEKLSATCAKVYLSTGMETTAYNHFMTQRIGQIKQRHGVSLKMFRTQQENFDNLRFFDALVAMGNEYVAQTFHSFIDGPIYTVNSHPPILPANHAFKKDYNSASKHFLYFASGGQIITGLDLLLDVFSERPDLHLYICSPFKSETDFVECFHDSLFKTANIHPIGFVRIGSHRYRKVVNLCGSVILPLCAGGSNGSVITCMHEGLIPITSSASGIASSDLRDLGVFLKSIEISAIADAVDYVASKSGEWLRMQSEKTINSAKRFYSEEYFEERFAEIVSVIEKNKRDAERQ